MDQTHRSKNTRTRKLPGSCWWIWDELYINEVSTYYLLRSVWGEICFFFWFCPSHFYLFFLPFPPFPWKRSERRKRMEEGEKKSCEAFWIKCSLERERCNKEYWFQSAASFASADAKSCCRRSSLYGITPAHIGIVIVALGVLFLHIVTPLALSAADTSPHKKYAKKQKITRTASYKRHESACILYKIQVDTW